MADVVFVDARNGKERDDVLIVDAVPHIDDDAVRVAPCRRVDEFSELGTEGVSLCVRIAPGMKLDIGRRELLCKLHHLHVRIDEQRYRYAVLREKIDDGLEHIEIGGKIETALGRDLFALFGDKGRHVGFYLDCCVDDHVGNAHLEVQFCFHRFAEKLHVARLYVALVLAKMHGDAVGPAELSERCRMYRVGLVRLARFAYGRDMIDVDAKCRHCCLRTRMIYRPHKKAKRKLTAVARRRIIPTMKGAIASLFRRIVSLAQAPVFPGDPERTRQAELLMPLLVMFIPVVIVSLFGLLFVFPAKVPSALVIMTVVLVVSVSYTLVRVGLVKAACIVFAAVTGIYTTTLVLFSGGMSGANVAHYIAFVVFLRLLFGTRVSIIAAVLVMLFLTFIAAATMNGIVFPRIFPVPAVPSLIMFLFALMIALTAVHTAVAKLDEAVMVGVEELNERARMVDVLALREKAEREHTARLTTLNNLVNGLARLNSFDDFFRHVVEGGRELGFSRISIWLIGDDACIMHGTFGIDEAGHVRDERAEHIALADGDIPARMLRSGDVVHVPSIALRDGHGNTVGSGANAAAPIVDGGRIIGAMCVDNLLSLEPFSEHDLSTLALYAANVGHLYAIKRAEAALHSYADELVRSNQELKEFVSIVSHDLKEPLRTASSFALLFKKRYDALVDERAQTYINAIVEEAERMQKLVDALVSYARSGNRARPFTAVDLNGVVAQVLATMRTRIEETGTAVTAGTLPVIQGDDVQLSQLFQNLIDNAVKFRADRPLTIAIAGECDADGWHVSVSDNGIGFDQAQADTVFSVFRRLVSRDYAGTGIGLAICKKVMLRHGGRIWATSLPGTGSVFHMHFPGDGASVKR